MLDVIKEYLVSLGFHVDSSSLNTAQRAMDKAENAVEGFASTSIKEMAKAAAGITTFVAAATLGLAKFIQQLGQADLQNEIFARRFWMNADAFKAYQNSIDALGVSLQDLYLSPELMQKYLQLRQEALQIQVPSAQYESEMKYVRSITFEFQKLKLEGTYALQWIGYYLIKYLEGPLGGAKDFLSKLNTLIQENMPDWTRKIAQIASWFVRLGVAAWDIRKALLAVVAIFAAFKIINMGPLGLMIAGITMLLLLVDDFYTYEKGGKSALPQLWKWVDQANKSIQDLFGTLKEQGIMGEFAESLGGLAGTVMKVAASVWALLNYLSQLAGYNDFGDMLGKNITEFFKRFVYIVEGLNKLLQATLDLLHGNMSQWWKDTKDELSTFNKALFGDGSNSSGSGKKGPNISNPDDLFKQFMDSYKKAYNETPGIVYPSKTSSTNNHVEMKPTYNIYGASNPNSVARTVQKSNNEIMTRAFKGVLV